MKPLTGGCLCGHVRYKTDAEMLMQYRCHCKDCQRLTGSAYLAAFAIPADSLNITGELKFYEKTADSGSHVALGFCPNCSSTLLGKIEIMPDVFAIAAGSLDDPEQYRPDMDIYTDSAVSWHCPDPNTVKCAREPG